jgi:hypothetical protein
MRLPVVGGGALSHRSIFLQACHRKAVGVASMKKEEATRAVLSDYDRWAKKPPNDASMMSGFLFFRYLQNERSDLLDFWAGDKWQIVHGWIRGRLEVLISLRGAGRQQTSESGKGK